MNTPLNVSDDGLFALKPGDDSIFENDGNGEFFGDPLFAVDSPSQDPFLSSVPSSNYFNAPDDTPPSSASSSTSPSTSTSSSFSSFTALPAAHIVKQETSVSPLIHSHGQSFTNAKNPSHNNFGVKMLQRNESAENLIRDIVGLLRGQEDRIQNVVEFQKNAKSEDDARRLHNEQQQLDSLLKEQFGSIQSVLRSTMISPGAISAAMGAIDALEVQMAQLTVLRQELEQQTRSCSTSSSSSEQPPQPFCARLVVAQDPFPEVAHKARKVQRPLVVRMVTGARVRILSMTRMKAAVDFHDDMHMPKTGPPPIEKVLSSGCLVPLEMPALTAKWMLCFGIGTRKLPAHLRFAVQAKVARGTGDEQETVTIESRQTKPFIVMTADSQWGEAEGILLEHYIFGKQGMEVPWYFIVNVLQRAFLQATHQEHDSPVRGLCHSDFVYFNNKGFGGQTGLVRRPLFRKFWAWFGRCLTRLKSDKHLRQLWLLGFFQGFLGREEIFKRLVRLQPGSFLLRFSERIPGQCAVAYRVDSPSAQQAVRHYLISDDDMKAGKLVDFLATQPSFVHVLQMKQDYLGRFLAHQVVHKDAAFSKMYSVSKKSIIPGYDPEPMEVLVSGQNHQHASNDDFIPTAMFSNSNLSFQ